MDIRNRRQDAERVLLTKILTEPEIFPEIELTPDNFEKQQHKNLFKALVRLHEEKLPFNPEGFVSLPDYVQVMDSIGGFKLIEELTSYEKVDKNSDFRDVQQVIIEECELEAKDKLAKSMIEEKLSVEESIERLKQIATSKTKKKDTSLGSILRRNYSELTTVSNGVMTGFSEIDKKTQGFRTGELIILGARPAMGKTAFALNIACNVAKSDLNNDGCVVVVFSMEMSEVELSRRIICMSGNVNAEKAKNPEKNFNESDWNKFNNTLAFLDSMDLEIADTSGLTVKGMRAELSRIRAKYGEHRKYFVIVDYLQLLQGKGKQRTEDVSEISRSLKLLAKDDNYIVLALSQLSRGVEQRQDKRPMLSDLRESGSIEQDADIVAFLYCDYYYNPQTDNPNLTEFIIAKQRAGATGKIETYFDRETLKFRDLAYRGVGR